MGYRRTMPLPVSKTALDRLGAKLTANDSIAEDDLEALAQVVGAYQEVLDGVKSRLTELGYRATTRVKTTGTLVDKLRRETARLSQVQDLAGARIVVPDRAAQDDAVAKIHDSFASSGCPCKVIDRRMHPSHGYRAVHLVVQVDRVPVEIQVRTDLQDTWAQSVERLADHWGRGIRYGEEPEAPDSRVEAPGLAASRREVLALFERLSEAIAGAEEGRQTVARASAVVQELETIADLMAPAASNEPDWVFAEDLPPGLRERLERLMANRPINDITTVFAGWRHMTAAEFVEALRRGCELARQENDRGAAEGRRVEQGLRVILQLLADATGRG